MFERFTPRTAYRAGVTMVAVAAPLALLTLLVWALQVEVPYVHDRPTLTLMGYMLFLLVAVAGGCVAMLASCHAAISRAFGHGYRAGQVTREAREDRPSSPGLRAVE